MSQKHYLSERRLKAIVDVRDNVNCVLRAKENELIEEAN